MAVAFGRASVCLSGREESSRLLSCCCSARRLVLAGDVVFGVGTWGPLNGRSGHNNTRQTGGSRGTSRDADVWTRAASSRGGEEGEGKPHSTPPPHKLLLSNPQSSQTKPRCSETISSQPLTCPCPPPRSLPCNSPRAASFVSVARPPRPCATVVLPFPADTTDLYQQRPPRLLMRTLRRGGKAPRLPRSLSSLSVLPQALFGCFPGLQSYKRQENLRAV